ncbi:MAG: radical SAM protein, partial [candidate division Zixibacteria bacterium]|nr:radical SAM protein [candidate division Zixibacteria bacterium]
DAGGDYRGKLSVEQIFYQIDYLINKRFPDGVIDTNYLKIQFARMGEPSFNNNVLDILEQLPSKYNLPKFIPSVSTIAPHGTDMFFGKLNDIKDKHYSDGFQLQFSLHSTDDKYRNYLMPVKKWSLKKIADYGNRFFNEGNRKITLNFALTTESIVDPQILLKYFNPENFLIKITPVNPTFSAKASSIKSLVESENSNCRIADELKEAGYDVIMSIGELEENKIGSNCGQYVQSLREKRKLSEDSYTYPLKTV